MRALIRSALLSFAVVLAAGGTWCLAQNVPTGVPPGAARQAAESAAPAFSPWTMTGAVAGWDAGTASFAAGHGIKGSYALGGTNDYLERTASVPTLSYPFWITGRFRPVATTGTQYLIQFSAGSDGAHRHLVYLSGTTLVILSQDAGGFTNPGATSAVAAGTWVTFVAIFTATDLYIYTNLNTTGGTASHSRAPTGIDRVHIGAGNAGSNDFACEVSDLAVYSGTGPDATQRTRIFAGDDPDGIATTNGGALLAGWRLDNSLTDRSGNGYDLTASGDSVTAQNKILVLRDRVSGLYHAQATTSAPAYDATLYSNRGGAAFASASSQFLVCESTPVPAAPFQVYAVARAADVTNGHCVFSLGDKDVADTDQWNLSFRGDVGGDPIRFGSVDSTAANADTSSGYSADTSCLLWAAEASNVSRLVEIDGGSQGTNTTDRTPDNADRIQIGRVVGTGGLLPLNGSIGFVLLLNTADTSQQADLEAWSHTEFGAPP